MAEVRFEPNEGFEAEMERDPSVLAVLANIAQAIVVDASEERVGKNEKRATVGRLTIETSAEGVVVVSHSSTWHWAEYGTVHRSPRAPIRGAVTQQGLRFEDAR